MLEQVKAAAWYNPALRSSRPPAERGQRCVKQGATHVAVGRSLRASRTRSGTQCSSSLQPFQKGTCRENQCDWPERGPWPPTLESRAPSLCLYTPDGALPASQSPNTPPCRFLHPCIDSLFSKRKRPARLAAQAPSPSSTVPGNRNCSSVVYKMLNPGDGG